MPRLRRSAATPSPLRRPQHLLELAGVGLVPPADQLLEPPVGLAQPLGQRDRHVADDG